MRASSEILLLKSILNTLSDSALSSSQVPLSPEHSSAGGKGDEDEKEKGMRRECKKRRGAEEGRGEGGGEQGKEEREQGKEEKE